MLFQLERLIDNMGHGKPLNGGRKIPGLAIFLYQPGRKVFSPFSWFYRALFAPFDIKHQISSFYEYLSPTVFMFRIYSRETSVQQCSEG